MQAVWDGIDKIYCISLRERTDRRAEARAQFEAVGLARRVEFVLVEKHPTDCEQGIYESHLYCIQKGIDAGAERILIFEDDIVFDRVTRKRLEHLNDFIRRHPSWRILFLGCMVKASYPTDYPSVRRIGYRSLTQAYVVHRRFAARLITYPWQQVAYDDFLRDLNNDEFYILHPAIAFQSNSPSDNERYLHLDRLRRAIGGLQQIQLRNEFYHCHRHWIIGAHLLVVLMIISNLLI